MQGSTARYGRCSTETIAGQNTAFHQKNAIVHAARLRFCCKKPDVLPVSIGRQIRFTGTTIIERKSVLGTRLLAPHLTCANTTIPYSSSLPLVRNGIIGGEADLVCLRHPCDDDEELCNTEEIEWNEFFGVSIAQHSIEARATKQLPVWCASTGQWVGGWYPCSGEWKPNSKR